MGGDGVSCFDLLPRQIIQITLTERSSGSDCFFCKFGKNLIYQMKFSFRVFIFLAIISNNFVVISQSVPGFVKNVYEDIYSSMDNGDVIKPKLILSNDIQEVATYKPSSNELIIGSELVRIARNFGKDSSNAIAHVLGHELAHILLQQNDMIKKIGSGYASKEFNAHIKKINNTLKDSVV